MKISIARGELLDALSVVSRGLSSRTTLPILSGIHIATRGDSVIFQATDLEVSIRTSCKARTEQAGESVLPGKLLTDVTRSLPEAAVTIDTTTTGVASVTCGQSSFSLEDALGGGLPEVP